MKIIPLHVCRYFLTTAWFRLLIDTQIPLYMPLKSYILRYLLAVSILHGYESCNFKTDPDSEAFCFTQIMDRQDNCLEDVWRSGAARRASTHRRWTLTERKSSSSYTSRNLSPIYPSAPKISLCFSVRHILFVNIHPEKMIHQSFDYFIRPLTLETSLQTCSRPIASAILRMTWSWNTRRNSAASLRRFEGSPPNISPKIPNCSSIYSVDPGLLSKRDLARGRGWGVQNHTMLFSRRG